MYSKTKVPFILYLSAERGRRNSGDTPKKASRDWMISENRALPLISPVVKYDPPTICLDKDESLVDDDLNNGPGVLDQSLNDILDQIDINGQKSKRRDTNIFHQQVMVGERVLINK